MVLKFAALEAKAQVMPFLHSWQMFASYMPLSQAQSATEAAPGYSVVLPKPMHFVVAPSHSAKAMHPLLSRLCYPCSVFVVRGGASHGPPDVWQRRASADEPLSEVHYSGWLPRLNARGSPHTVHNPPIVRSNSMACRIDPDPHLGAAGVRQ